MDNFLRFDFSKGGKVTIYAEFPKGMQLKGRKLGQWPELLSDTAREKAQKRAKKGLTAESVHGFCPHISGRFFLLTFLFLIHYGVYWEHYRKTLFL